ncbi:hypothetical protein EDD17DRAFT_1521737, partial [Pisolithus thermaeus]
YRLTLGRGVVLLRCVPVVAHSSCAGVLDNASKCSKSLSPGSRATPFSATLQRTPIEKSSSDQPTSNLSSSAPSSFGHV